jgi:hypothetical protein
MPIVTYNYSAYTSNNSDIPAKLRKRFVVGDVIIFDILLAPPNAFYLRGKKWTIRDNSLESTVLTKNTYPSSVKSTLFLRVPNDVVFTDDLRVAVWSDDHDDWVEDGISDYQYNENSRMLQFYVTTVGMFALVKNRVVEMPYKKWSLEPIFEKKNTLYGKNLTNNNNNETSIENITKNIANLNAVDGVFSSNYECQARFSIETQKFEIVIDIVGSKCKLVRPNDKVFIDLVGVSMDPGNLLNKLQRRGVNLLPTQYDSKNIENFKTKVFFFVIILLAIYSLFTIFVNFLSVLAL